METNVLGLLTEALTAQVKVVLADQTSLVLADAAKRMSSQRSCFIVLNFVDRPFPSQFDTRLQACSKESSSKGKKGRYQASYHWREPLP